MVSVNVSRAKILLFVFASASFLLASASAATSETKNIGPRISPELCGQLRKGKSRLLSAVLCPEVQTGSPQPPPDVTSRRRNSRDSSDTCDRLCRTGFGGAVCDCNSGLPPAVKPPEPPKQPVQPSQPKQPSQPSVQQPEMAREFPIKSFRTSTRVRPIPPP